MSGFLPPLDLLLNHPCLITSRDEFSIIYSGPVIVNANMYETKIREYSNSEKKKTHFSNIENRLSGNLKSTCIDTGNIYSCLKQLAEEIEENNPSVINYTSYYRKILLEFKEFRKFYIDLKTVEVSPNLSSIGVSFNDQGNREHFLRFGVDYKEPEIFYFKEFDVPIKGDNILNKKSSNLKELYSWFLTYIEELQPFFDFMDMIDANSTVVDKNLCQKKFNYRRILLDSSVSVIITVDPCNMKCCPNFAFIGPEDLVNQYRCRLEKNLENWNDQNYLYEQILLVLEIEEFPKGLMNTFDVNDNILKSDMDCSICFSSELKGFLPDVVCDNKSCANVFHKFCLFEWLSSIDSRKYFNDIQGPCPNCEKIICCPIFVS
ncbi:E3 ubiquitin-protein ligase FANCL [Coccinella septempunctata]|uniref:E3 ubiquitin-protein ligase FANCL n=1 Tax=Coccinella septempunctata TaxID=41139 RepID=UPI001D07830E|nr:E3 ubiquitin-protein ligase FANCL [Coccinella septempunctata]